MKTIPKRRSPVRIKRRHIHTDLEVARLGAGFQACVRVGTQKGTTDDGRWACAVGKNPRAAIAATFHKIAKGITRRSGAFAGLR